MTRRIEVAVALTILALLAVAACGCSGCSYSSGSRAWVDSSGEHSIQHIYNPRTHRVEAVTR